MSALVKNNSLLQHRSWFLWWLWYVVKVFLINHYIVNVILIKLSIFVLKPDLLKLLWLNNHTKFERLGNLTLYDWLNVKLIVCVDSSSCPNCVCYLNCFLANLSITLSRTHCMVYYYQFWLHTQQSWLKL